MVKLIGNDVWRGSEKIGWIEGDYVRDRDGKKLGYFQDRFVYDMDAHKIAYIEGDYLVSEGSGSEARLNLEKVAEEVQGGVLSELGKCAVYVLLGD
ncbi:MAG: 4-fold beta flower protein [Minisyncoccia bacterium]